MRRGLVVGGMLLAVLTAAAFVAPWTVRARGMGIVEPTFKTWVRAPEGARVGAVLVREGEHVRKDQPLIELYSDELEVSVTAARASVGALEREVAAARGRTERLRAAELALYSRRAELDVLRARAARLVVQAPFDAVVVTPRTELLAGAGVDRGQELLELWAPAPIRLRIRLDLRDVGGVEPGDDVAVRFASWPGTEFQGMVETVRAASESGAVEVLAGIRDPDNLLRPGLQGRAKVAADRTTVARAIGRAARRMIRVDWML